MSVGIAIIYKDGKKDWFDPVVEETIKDKILTITIESGNQYEVILPEVSLIKYYEV